MQKKRGSKKKASVKPSAKSSAGLSEAAPVSSPQINVEAALNDLERTVAAAKNKPDKEEGKASNAAASARASYAEPSRSAKPMWFYISSIFAAFMFTLYISVFVAIHFESIAYMNLTIVFIFISMVSYFLISSIFFISEKRGWHGAVSLLFFIGLVAIMIYAFKAVDTSNLVRFSIIYAIIVAAISCYVLAVRK